VITVGERGVYVAGNVQNAGIVTGDGGSVVIGDHSSAHDRAQP
jgi:hypothetical protein